MGQHTPIQWCDSAVNPVMGCDGCELWAPEKGVRLCYAGKLHDVRAGRPGYADAFLSPKLFPGRMEAAASWSDLRGKARPDKPWLDGRPRHIFISDMGDALSASVPFQFLYEDVIRHVTGEWGIGRRHIWQWPTKQPQRMAEFDAWLAKRGVEWPSHLWAGTSITGPGQGARVRHLRRVRAAVRFLSVEPMLHDPGALDLDGIAWVIVGGASGPGAPPTDIGALWRLVERARRFDCAVFVKQLGAHPRVLDGEQRPPLPVRWWRSGLAQRLVYDLDDPKGGDPSEWPADLRVREWPRASHLQPAATGARED